MDLCNLSLKPNPVKQAYPHRSYHWLNDYMQLIEFKSTFLRKADQATTFQYLVSLKDIFQTCMSKFKKNWPGRKFQSKKSSVFSLQTTFQTATSMDAQGHFPHTNAELNQTSDRGVANFSTSCKTGWLSFPHIMKIARMTSTHWPHQHFELLSFLAPPNNA